MASELDCNLQDNAVCPYCGHVDVKSKSAAPKLYADRDPAALDASGGHYSRHVAAMTAEGLHDKSAIAGELAWRDAEIERLKREAYDLEMRYGCPKVGEQLEQHVTGELRAELDRLKAENARLREAVGDGEVLAAFAVEGCEVYSNGVDGAWIYRDDEPLLDCDHDAVTEAERKALRDVEPQAVRVAVVVMRGGE